MNTCKTRKTCKHWVVFAPSGAKNRLNECDSPSIHYGSKLYSAPYNGAQVELDKGWGMLTGPDFGCVLHGEKL